MIRGHKTGRRVLALVIAMFTLFSLLTVSAGAANDNGLVVEKLTFRDVLRLYSADRASFGVDALHVNEKGVANASERLAEMFAFTVGLNYTGEGKNSNYFGKDVTAKMDEEPYITGNLLATYQVEIRPYRSYALALPEGQTTAIRVYLVGYVNAANGVEPVLHYVWQDEGRWWAVKDDNPYYRVSYNGQSARQSGVTLVQSRAGRGGSGLEAWQDLSAAEDGNGIVHLSGSTLVAGQGAANVFGVTGNVAALQSAGGLASSLTAVSDFVRGDTTCATGPLVHSRDCYEDGTMHRVADGEKLRAGVTYRFRVVYDEALAKAPGTAWKDVGLQLRSEVTGETRAMEDFVWYGSEAYLTSDRYNPHTIEFTFTPEREGTGVCTFLPVNLVGSESGLKAAEFHTCTAAGTGTAPAESYQAVALAAKPETESAVETTPAPTPAQPSTPAPAAEPVKLAATRATTLPVLTVGGGDVTVTRSMLAESLWILSGRPAAGESHSWLDMPRDNDTRQAVLWAANTGLITAYGETFGTDQPVTREQAAVVLQRYAVLCGADTSSAADLGALADGGEVSAWAAESVSWAVGSGTMHTLSNGLLAPGEEALSGDVTGMIFRLEQSL